MRRLATFDREDYSGTTSLTERYTIRGILIRGGKLAMQRDKDGEYKIPGGGMEPGETHLQTLEREVLEETGLRILPETAVALGEILEVRRDLYEAERKFICHTIFYYCKDDGRQYETHLTESENERGYHLEWATPREIYDWNFHRTTEPWILRDTAFVKALIDGRVSELIGCV